LLFLIFVAILVLVPTRKFLAVADARMQLHQQLNKASLLHALIGLQAI
jgi:hypothetical protein